MDLVNTKMFSPICWRCVAKAQRNNTVHLRVLNKIACSKANALFALPYNKIIVISFIQIILLVKKGEMLHTIYFHIIEFKNARVLQYQVLQCNRIKQRKNATQINHFQLIFPIHIVDTSIILKMTLKIYCVLNQISKGETKISVSR